MRLESPPELEAFPKRVRAFVAENAPGPKTHTGVRAPEPELVPRIREWTAKLFAAGLLGIDWPQRFGGGPHAPPLGAHIVGGGVTPPRTRPPPRGPPPTAA